MQNSTTTPDFLQLEQATPQQTITYLENTYGLDTDTAKVMINSLKATLIEEFNKAENFIASDDLSALSKVAHTIKGALRNGGVNEWAVLAEKIEHQDVTDNNELKTGLTTLLQALKHGLKPLLQ